MSSQALASDRAFTDFGRPIKAKRDWLIQRLIARLTSHLPPVTGNTDGHPEIYPGF